MSKVGESLLRGVEQALAHAQGEKLKGMETHKVKVLNSIDVHTI